MQQTKPLFLIRKYRSILTAAITVEAVNYIVSLTDSIVAGNMLGNEALTGIGVLSPFLLFSFFVSSIIISGTVMNYSYEIGRFDRKRAGEFFSQGVTMALLVGIVYPVLLLLLREPILSVITGSGPVREYAREYFNIILFFYFLTPIANLLDNLVIADGGEKLSAAANIVMIVSNVAFSLLFAVWWGIQGVALASVLSKVLFVLVISFSFFGKNNTLRLIPHWNAGDFWTIVRDGIVKASTYALEALMYFLINLFALSRFPESTMVLLVMAEKFLGLLTLFIGLSMSAQPLIGTLKGEKNIKALRLLMRRVCVDLFATGGILSLLTIAAAPFLVSVFGISAEPLRTDGIIALRIVGSTLSIHAILVQFFIFYYLTDKPKLSFFICVHKNLINPVGLVVLLSVLTSSQIGMWTGLAAAPVLSLLVCTAVVFLRSRKDKTPFPFLLPVDTDRKTYIYDFDLVPEKITEMARTADELMKAFPVSAKTRMVVEILIEDLLMLILEKNAKRKGLYAECTMIAEPDGVRMILRDSGVIFDITDEDAFPDSFRQYVAASFMTVQKNKMNITTTGYNRNEFFFAYTPDEDQEKPDDFERHLRLL